MQRSVLYRTENYILMRPKLLIFFLLVGVGATMTSCRKQQCPAYGKTSPKSIAEKKHC